MTYPYHIGASVGVILSGSERNGFPETLAQNPALPRATTHYLDNDFSPQKTDALKIHSPALIVFLLAIVKVLEPLIGVFTNGNRSGVKSAAQGRC